MASYSFAGKHIIVTGATGGIGTALVKQLAQTGAKLALNARSEANLKELVETFPKKDHIISIPADLSVPGEAKKLAETAIKALNHVDVLFNLAGVGYFALMEEVTEENMRYLFELNTFSPIVLTSALLPHMTRRGSGRIINIVSCAGRIPIPTEGIYGGSKSAFAIMANTMRFETAPKNIDILNIYPGTAASDFERNARRENERPGVCPLESCGEPLHEIAARVLEAASGPPGEVWLERNARWMAAAALLWPRVIDKRLKPLRDKALGPVSLMFPTKKRPWRLWQVESAIACNLKCIMCPWTGYRKNTGHHGLMDRSVWEALKPHLHHVQSIDFTGGGEPLLQPHLAEWISDAKAAGCETGLLTNGLLLDAKKAGQLLDAGLDWICFSVDGTDAAVYESIRAGSNFKTVTKNIAGLCKARLGNKPKTMINFVIMAMNAHQLEEIVRLAAQLGVDQVNFKQCDVIRGEHGKGMGLFAHEKTREIKALEKILSNARKIGKKLKVTTTAFSFTPEELPVCVQDPRNSVFIRHDGSVAPCINLAIGGPTTFLGREVTMPSVHYGRLPDKDIETLWESEPCLFYRQRFEKRLRANDKGFLQVDQSERSLLKLKAAEQAAIDAMPEAPEGCRVCHYLYGI